MTTLWRALLVGVPAVLLVYVLGFSTLFATEYRSAAADMAERFIPLPVFDRADYDARLLALAHVVPVEATSSATTTISRTAPWPVKTVYPNIGAVLPFKRIVAYYGNFYSKGMGILGE